MRGRRRGGLIVALAAFSLTFGCSGADDGGAAPETRSYTTAGLSSATTACHQMAAHQYLRAADTINAATKHTEQWADLAHAVRTVAWSKSWVGDVGLHMTREQATNLIKTTCTQVTRQTASADPE